MSDRGWILLLAIVVIVGCQAPENKAAQAPGASQASAPPMAAPASQEDPAEAKQLASFQTEYEQAKSAYDKNPKSKEAKDTYVITTVRLGTATMTAASLAPKEKYPKALNLYREALKLDPSNKEAASNKKMIEDIYQSMGRPVPGSA